MQSDDRAIKEEGLDNLTDDELRGACRARGMRTPYGEGAVAFMRKQLQEWLDLSLNRYGSTQCIDPLHCDRGLGHVMLLCGVPPCFGAGVPVSIPNTDCIEAEPLVCEATACNLFQCMPCLSDW